jgi:WD40 repeat protein/serine/threonine protein kinase
MPNEPSMTFRPDANSEIWTHWELVIERFEDAWQRGESPSIEEHAQSSVGDLGLELVRELAHIDLEYRFKRHESARVDSYFATFPQLLSHFETASELIRTEFRFRKRSGEQPSAADYASRFPQFAESIPSILGGASESCDSSITGGVFETAETVPISQSRTDLPQHPPNQSGANPIPTIPGYEIFEEVGRGGMGIVYRARQPRLQRFVALKMIRDSLLTDKNQMQRFEDEAKAFARLDHPNIIKIYEIGDVLGQPYFSMELADQGNLTDRLADGPLTPKNAASVMLAIAQAVQHAHEHGILHRDLKPMNIVLVSRHDMDCATGHSGTPLLDVVQPKITDFGLAKLLGSESGKSIRGDLLGTPSYMAPEQLSGSAPITVAADVYALGAVLYELLSGRPAFQGTDFLETWDQVRSCEPILPRELNPAVPLDLETICLKCLEKEPARRYRSAGLLAEELVRFLTGKPILARPVSAIARIYRWCRRNPLTSTLLVAVATATIGGTATATFFAVEADTRATAEKVAKEQYQHELKRTRASLVTSQLWRAASFLDRDPWQSWELLQDQDLIPLEERDFTWRLLANRCQSLSEVVPIDTRKIDKFALSADGKRLATATGHEVTIWDWDARTLRENSRLPPIPGSSLELTFSPDGQVLAISGVESELWDVNKKCLRSRLGAKGPMAFSNDSRILATVSRVATKLELQRWELESGQCVNKVFIGPEVGNVAIAYNPDGKMLAISRSSIVTLHDAVTGDKLRDLPGQKGIVFALAFSPDGEALVSQSSDGICIWNLKRRVAPRVLIEYGDSGQSIAFSSDGQTLATIVNNAMIHIWDRNSGEVRQTLRGKVSPTGRVEFMRDHNNLISTCSDGQLRLWEMTSKPQSTEIPRERQGATTIAFSSDGKTLAMASMIGTSIQLMDLASGTRQTLEHGVEVLALAYSPDGQTLAAVGGKQDESSLWISGRVKMWDLSSGRAQAMLSEPTAAALCLAFSPKGDILATGSSLMDNANGDVIEGQIVLWDVRSRKRLSTLRGPSNEIRCLAFHPDGRLLAASSDAQSEARVTLWDLTNSQVVTSILDLPHSEVPAVTFSPDGKTLLVGCGKTVLGWDLSPDSESTLPNLNPTRLPRVMPKPSFVLSGHYGDVSSIAFGDDAKTLATASFDGKVFLWNLANRQHRATLVGRHSPIVGLSFSPNDHVLATASADGTVLIHQTFPSTELLPVPLHSEAGDIRTGP